MFVFQKEISVSSNTFGCRLSPVISSYQTDLLKPPGPLPKNPKQKHLLLVPTASWMENEVLGNKRKEVGMFWAGAVTLVEVMRAVLNLPVLCSSGRGPGMDTKKLILLKLRKRFLEVRAPSAGRAPPEAPRAPSGPHQRW